MFHGLIGCGEREIETAFLVFEVSELEVKVGGHRYLLRKVLDILVSFRFIASPFEVLLELFLYGSVIRLVEIGHVVLSQEHLARLILLLGISHADLKFIYRLLMRSMS